MYNIRRHEVKLQPARINPGVDPEICPNYSIENVPDSHKNANKAEQQNSGSHMTALWWRETMQHPKRHDSHLEVDTL